MDCYLASLHRLINDCHVTAAELSFLSNYSVSRAWLDTEAADSFDIPVIYPSWFPNFNEVQQLYPQLQVLHASNFQQYVSMIHERLAYGSVVTAIDRYYLDYITPRRHMGAHYIVVNDIVGDHLSYADPYDDSEHTVSIDDLKLWTAPPYHPVQYMGYSVAFIDTSIIPKRSLLTLDAILSQRIAKIQNTIKTIRKFRRVSMLPSEAQRFFLKLALGGMSESDFNKMNGRFENWEFFTQKKMSVSAAIEIAIIGYYRTLAMVFTWIYAKGIEITRRRWLIFVNLYIVGLKIELLRYQTLKSVIHGTRAETSIQQHLEAMK